MTNLKQKQNQGDSGEGEQEIWINMKNSDDIKPSRLKVKKGTHLKEFLANLKYNYRRGLVYKLNNVLLETNKETGELLKDPVLEEEATLVIEQTFIGGSNFKI